VQPGPDEQSMQPSEQPKKIIKLFFLKGLPSDVHTVFAPVGLEYPGAQVEQDVALVH